MTIQIGWTLSVMYIQSLWLVVGACIGNVTKSNPWWYPSFMSYMMSHHRRIKWSKCPNHRTAHVEFHGIPPKEYLIGMVEMWQTLRLRWTLLILFIYRILHFGSECSMKIRFVSRFDYCCGSTACSLSQKLHRWRLFRGLNEICSICILNCA